MAAAFAGQNACILQTQTAADLQGQLVLPAHAAAAAGPSKLSSWTPLRLAQQIQLVLHDSTLDSPRQLPFLGRLGLT